MIIITIMMIVIKISLIIMLVIMIIITVLESVAYHTQNLREKQYFSERIIIIKWFEIGMMIN